MPPQEDLRRYKHELDKVRTALYIKSPFIATLIMGCKVVLVDRLGFPAAAGEDTIYLDRGFFESKEKMVILAHEALHVALRHVFRMKTVVDRERDIPKQAACELYNLASDAVVNEILSMHGMNIPYEAVTMYRVAKMLGVHESDINKLAAENLYVLLKRNVKVVELPAGYWMKGDMEAGRKMDDEMGCGEGSTKIEEKRSGSGNALVLQEDQFKGASWEEKISRALNSAKVAGNVPAGLERLVKISRGEVNWRSVLRDIVSSGCKKIVETPFRLSRKHPELPGIKKFGVSNVWVLVDTSGSIGDEELAKFVGEMLEMCRSMRASLKVVFWDAQPYGIQEVRSISDFKNIKVMGGGGTMIGPTLDLVLKNMKYGDPVVILSDGYIADVSESAQLFQKVKSKSRVAVFASTGIMPELPPGWVQVSIRW
ncbi:MAG: hypothetical protein DRJ47_06770 [Thermoprotei archaeon]|nr:MAG: hypothetical protein DRJ47_06770 [Thermoprotei archaeon]